MTDFSPETKWPHEIIIDALSEKCPIRYLIAYVIFYTIALSLLIVLSSLVFPKMSPSAVENPNIIVLSMWNMVANLELILLALIVMEFFQLYTEACGD